MFKLGFFNPFKSFKQSSLKAFSLLFVTAFSLNLIIAACSPNNPTTTTNSSPTASSTASPTASPTIGAIPVRVGFQKSATVLFSLKGKGTLEKVFQPTGSSVTWSEFTQGLPMIEALNAGALDIGYVGEAPPIFGQAAGDFIRYIAYDPFGVEAEGIVVPKDSPIKTLADLKGKKIAVAKGSNAHYLVISALASVGLQPSDVDFKFVRPGDARAAFEKKEVDAWSIWDPYLAAAEVDAGARLLTSAKGLAPDRGYYLATRTFVEKNPEAVKLILAEIRTEAAYARENSTEIAKFLSPALGLSVPILEKAEKRRTHDALPLTDEVIEKQQVIADTFAKLKLIPKQIQVKEIVWQPQ